MNTFYSNSLNTNGGFNGRVALITAASGLGAVAKRLGSEGAQLVLLDRREQILHDLCRELEIDGISVIGVTCNIAAEFQVIESVNWARQHLAESISW